MEATFPDFIITMTFLFKIKQTETDQIPTEPETRVEVKSCDRHLGKEAGVVQDIFLSEDDASFTFPQKLIAILSNDDHSEILGWLHHGRSFIIYDKKKFGLEILPHYFKQSKFASFTRKLSRWGFALIKNGPNAGSYYHKLFCRDKPRLCAHMTCRSRNLKNSATSQEATPLLQMRNTSASNGSNATSQGNSLNALAFSTTACPIFQNIGCMNSTNSFHQRRNLISQRLTQGHSFEEYSRNVVSAAIQVLKQGERINCDPCHVTQHVNNTNYFIPENKQWFLLHDKKFNENAAMMHNVNQVTPANNRLDLLSTSLQMTKNNNCRATAA